MGSIVPSTDGSLHLLCPTTGVGRGTNQTIRIDRPELFRDHLLLRSEWEGWTAQSLSKPLIGTRHRRVRQTLARVG